MENKENKSVYFIQNQDEGFKDCITRAKNLIYTKHELNWEDKDGVNTLITVENFDSWKKEIEKYNNERKEGISEQTERKKRYE